MKRAGDGLRMRMWVLRGNWLQFSSGGVDSVSCGVERNRVNAYLGWHHFFDFVRVGRILTNDSQCTVAATNKNASPNGVVDRVVDPFPTLKSGQFVPLSPFALQGLEIENDDVSGLTIRHKSAIQIRNDDRLR